MAYEDTEVPVSRSQDAIKKMVYSHKGTGVMFISRPPTEGFEAFITLAEKPYHFRIVATCKKVSNREQEERRVWRVLYYHLKALFEAADSGVISIEHLFIPYVITPDNRTIGEHIIPRLAELARQPERMARALTT